MSKQLSSTNCTAKLILVGDVNVGKTSLMQVYVDGIFSNYIPMTIGVDFMIKNVQVDNIVFRVQIWDTAGQERYRTITSSYYRGAHGIFIVYDVTNRTSFNNAINWLKESNTYADDSVPKILLGNKIDSANRTVSEDEGKKFALDNNISFLEVSAKDNININDAFMTMLKQIDIDKINNPFVSRCKRCGTPIRKNENHYNCYGLGDDFDKGNSCCS
jgi:Ras-related protein Rab-1A